MEYRKPLQIHAQLAFEGMTCYIEKEIGCGSNAIVYKGWYWDRLNKAQRHYVLIKELFPFHPQGKIWRDGQQRIVVEPEGRETWELHRESFLAGNEIHLRLLAEHPDELGANLNSFSCNGTLYTVLGFNGGRSLQAEWSASAPSLGKQVRRMVGILDALEAFHKSGYLHLDISPDNIMLVGQEDRERIFLIDYNSVQDLSHHQNARLSQKAGFSPPEVATGNLDAIGFSSDLYSVAAVFFRCLMGRPLTLEEQLRPKAPDGRDSPYLENAPQTVSDLVRRILRKGLHSLPGKRYQSTGQMRRDFLELLDRIDCVGVTHWALWENGRKSVEALIRQNPSYGYLLGDEKLFPIRLNREGGVSFSDYLETLLSETGRSGLIVAEGGMGKTTLLLHGAMLQSKNYTPSAPAVFYISLGGWRGDNPYYIRDQILLRLRFKPEMNLHESAVHALHQLLQQPLQIKSGTAPVALLLLDGLNEARGELGPLIQEINQLAGLPGVRILAASRSPMPEVNLETISLLPLEDQEVGDILGENGLLIPRKDAVRCSLRTPLILSIYLQTCQAGTQAEVDNQSDLINAYLLALQEKEFQQLPEQGAQRWQVGAALFFVLPFLAVEMERQGGSMTGEQLLQTVRRCWKLVDTSAFRHAFPQWIGHSKDIRAEAKTPEQWYGLMIHDLLWQRLGMLTKEPDGSYRIYHQILLEHIARTGKQLRRSIRNRQNVLRIGVGMVLTIAAMALCLFAMPRSYDPKQTETVLDHLTLCYSTYGHRAMDVQQLLDKARNPDDFLFWYDRYAAKVDRAIAQVGETERYAAMVSTLCASGDRVSWSHLPMEEAAAQQLIAQSTEHLQVYAEYLPVLKQWVQSPRAQAECPEFPETFRALVEADEQIMSKLFFQACVPHLTDAEAVWQSNIQELIAPIPFSGKEPEEALYKLEDNRKQAKDQLMGQSVTVTLICQEEL